MNKERITYDQYVEEVDKRVNLTETEPSEIVVFLYQDGWTVRECCDHIKSVRRFNEN